MIDDIVLKEVDEAAAQAASAAWLKAKKVLDRAKAAEDEARKALVSAAFPNGLDEGTNTFNLPGKWKLKVSGVVSRSIDEAALPAILERIRGKFDGYDAKEVVKYKPELRVADYKKMPADVRKLFDNALTIKGTGETSPQVKIEEAKR